ncbi:MAG: beta-ketoacyl-[acyl-carrier-protein] synthase family protein [Candidatus Rokuibacteriota bacterium]
MPAPAPEPIRPRRVVITGMGVATGLGLEWPDLWHGLLNGACGIRPVSFADDHPELPVRIAGQVDDDRLATGLQRYALNEPDRGNQLGLYVVGRALEDAGLPVDGRSPLPFDLIVGSGHGNVSFSNEATRTFIERGFRRLRPTTVVRVMFSRAASVVSIRYKLIGASFTVSAACATGAVALGEAFQRIRFGLVDGAVAACCDSGLDLYTFAAWNRLGVLSRIPEPELASRPFDRRRDGLVIGEGAAAFVLESAEAAAQRGARIWAEIAGYGCASDATHIVRPDLDGQVRAMHAALHSAGMAADDIDAVNAHGTATELADVVEAASLVKVLGARAAAVPVTTTKAQLGHLMGATAGVELVTSILGLHHGLLPPCRNLDDPDPRCTLDFVREVPRAAAFRVVLKNSFAFGGTNSAVILRKAPETDRRLAAT